MAIFQIFKITAAAILDYKNFKFLTAGRVKTVELRRLAKFRGGRSNRCRDIAIFAFVEMAAAAILELKNLNF